ncbi:MDR family oxidoreductase [Celerinatantimonas sp. YJH-8]|uniref:acrylyl-CoA reductase (NADPH) n=1 Tax=Celerinatantimonas sp. YJH-8 TaxID=3228714 RepID=UPI0038C1AC58
MFKALLVDKVDEQYQVSVRELDEDAFFEGDVTVSVAYSSLNFKDGLAISGRSPVVRRFPMVPGIDFAGTVENSEHPDFQVGQKVFINGWGLGEKHWGGLAQKAKVCGDWLLPLPQGLSEYDVMAVGTAGYTAMLAVMALEKQGVTPASGPILVTGANGGVGSFAIAFLAKLGFQVTASTGRLEAADRLRQLGASEVIDRQSLSEKGRPLGKELWAGAIDSVGSYTLANVCAGTQYGGAVAACGLAQGMDFPATVAPFILRGITLCGIDSVMCPLEKRRDAWERIAQLVDPAMIDAISTQITFEQCIEQAYALLDGQVQGRLVVDLSSVN